MTAVVLLALVAYFVGIPTAMWASTLEASRHNWPARVAGLDHVAQGSYRDADVPRMSAAGAPRVVQFASLGAWILGTMFVPGLLGGLGGLFMMGVGAVSIPGLILAWRLFFLAGPLMRGEAIAAPRARAAARFARVLNYVVLAACIVAATLSVALEHHDLAGLYISAAVALYALISLGHARLLDRAAEHVEALTFSPQSALTGVRIDAAPRVAVQADETPDAARAPAHTTDTMRGP